MGGISDNTFGGGTPKTSEKKYWNGTIPWIQSSDLTINNLFLKKTKKFITENAISESATKVVPAQSIAVVTRVGVGKLALIPFTYTTSQDFLSFSNLNIDKYFAVYNMYALLKKISQNLQGTSIKGVTKSDLLDKKIYVSNFIEEQQAIGSLFKKIDNLIVLQQRKIDTLKLLKKALLQQVFPENGEDIPKVRFSNFTDKWEQRNLNNIYKSVNEKNDLTLAKNRIISVAKMQWGKTPTESTDKYMRTYNVMRIGNIAFEGNKSKFFKYGRFVENTIGDGLISHVFVVFRPLKEMNLSYWKYFIHDESIMHNVLRMSTTKATMMTNLVKKRLS